MSANFHVWCLSWDDTEEDGKDVVTVDLLAALNRPRSKHGPIEVGHGLDAEAAAEEYASYAHDRRDGNESTWPLVFRVRGPDGTLQDFSVDRDFDPTFRAAPLRKAAEERQG